MVREMTVWWRENDCVVMLALRVGRCWWKSWRNGWSSATGRVWMKVKQPSEPASLPTPLSSTASEGSKLQLGEPKLQVMLFTRNLQMCRSRPVRFVGHRLEFDWFPSSGVLFIVQPSLWHGGSNVQSVHRVINIQSVEWGIGVTV